MVNLNEMNTKELKAMAKELEVKNWWNLKKSELINEIALAIGDKEDAGEEVDVDAIAEAAATGETTIPEGYQATTIDGTIVAVSKTIDLTADQDEPEEAEEEAEEINEADSEAPQSEPEGQREVKKPSLKIKELTFDGKTQTIREWANELEMPWPTLYDRINRNGWTVEEALTIPLGGRRKRNS